MTAPVYAYVCSKCGHPAIKAPTKFEVVKGRFVGAGLGSWRCTNGHGRVAVKRIAP